jgi:hypothetical protein
MIQYYNKYIYNIIFISLFIYIWLKHIIAVIDVQYSTLNGGGYYL